MQEIPGFIGSCARTQERNSSSELYYLLHDILECKKVVVSPVSSIAGLTLTTFDENQFETLKKVQNEVEKDNSTLQYTLKLVPFQYRISTTLENLKETSLFFSKKIQKSDSWRINLRRRHSNLNREEIIKVLASEIKNGKVSLENPDFYLITEVVGKWTYLALSTEPELALSQFIEIDDYDDFTF
jgi:tRNA(Ser,Leu) C12 N-acetylase TAN1